MSPFRSILVPLDGSPLAERALPLATRIASRSGARLELATVRAPVHALALATDVPVGAAPPAGRAGEDASYLEKCAAEVERTAGVAATTVMLDGPVPEALSARVKEAGVDLVVMSTHGRNAFSRLWLGSVADALLRTLEAPMLLVRPHPGARAGSHPFGRILLALDGSATAAEAIEPALALGTHATEFVCCRIVEPPLGIASLPYPVAVELETASELERQAADYLDGVVAGLRARGMHARFVVEVAPGAAMGLLQAAEREQVDLIALATRGLRGFERFLLGSVADKVVRGAEQPVLVVPPAREG
jgi:nucleotide-binding universal stress UspA family protein